MGVNNRQRRAAKKKRVKQRPGQRPGQHDAWERFVPEMSAEVARAFLVEALVVIDADATAAAPTAQLLLRPDGPLPPVLARTALASLLAELTGAVVARGWRPTDLAQIVTRRLGEAQVPAVLGLLAAEGERHLAQRVAAAWLDDLAAAGRPAPRELQDAQAVQAALELATCLATLPEIAVLIPPPGAAEGRRVSGEGGDPKLLARVRALLAKAESTEFDEEADALSAKAQELISRHALERLLAEADARSAGDRPGEPPAVRRIWIDPPYVFAKGMLVDAVADANRCRSVMVEKLGFCTVIGREADLVAVDLLVTSLLLQAGTSLRRHGRQTDRSGTSRTKSFRQSFLVSYASRIRERLHAAGQDAVRDTGRSAELVPVLHRHAEQVEAATEALFPRLVSREAAISNAKGWAAGRAAADLALLDVDLQLTEAAS